MAMAEADKHAPAPTRVTPSLPLLPRARRNPRCAPHGPRPGKMAPRHPPGSAPITGRATGPADYAPALRLPHGTQRQRAATGAAVAAAWTPRHSKRIHKAKRAFLRDLLQATKRRLQNTKTSRTLNGWQKGLHLPGAIAGTFRTPPARPRPHQNLHCRCSSPCPHKPETRCRRVSH